MAAGRPASIPSPRPQALPTEAATSPRPLGRYELAAFPLGAAARHSSASSHSNQPYEMISPQHLGWLLSAGLSPAVANYFFDNPHAMLNMGANGQTLDQSQVARVQRAWPHATIGWVFDSFGPNTLTGNPGIQTAVIPAGVSYIQYDPEGPANGTPTAESSALARGDTSYVRAAAAVAHAHGLRFAFTPSIDSGMTGIQSTYSLKYSTWLSEDRGAWAAIPGVDLYSIQTQQAEGTSTFDSFTAAAISQARAAAPTTPIDVGLGINPSNPPTPITTADIMAGYTAAAADGAAGYWHNVEVGVGANVPPSVYVAFFNQLYAQLNG